MLILSLDTSGKLASCALARDGAVLAQTVQDARLDHSRLLLPLCGRLLEEQGLKLSQIDLFAAVAGPGSFTGVRIGVAAVKGFCWALDKPCVGVSSLEAMAWEWEGSGPVCCSLYARPGERYYALFQKEKAAVRRLTPDTVGSEEALTGEMARFSCQTRLEDCQRASGAAKAAWAAAREGRTQNCCDILPAYLRVPQAERMRNAALAQQAAGNRKEGS